MGRTTIRIVGKTHPTSFFLSFVIFHLLLVLFYQERIKRLLGVRGHEKYPFVSRLHRSSSSSTWGRFQTNHNYNNNQNHHGSSTWTNQNDRIHDDMMQGGNSSIQNTAAEYNSTTNTITRISRGPIQIVFSDVDGTLIHYPKHHPNATTPFLEAIANQEINNSSILSLASNRLYDRKRLLYRLPPSRTGMQGIISSETYRLCHQLRHRYNIKLVLISGMRTSTMIQRLPFLPKADAYCSENGGRIFYPVPIHKKHSSLSTSYPHDDEHNHHQRHHDLNIVTTITPQRIPYDAATDDIDDHDKTSRSGVASTKLSHPTDDMEEHEDDDKIPFGLVEDWDWRNMMEQLDAAGPDGYQDDDDDDDDDDRGVVMDTIRTNVDHQESCLQRRRGVLWNYAKHLITQHDLVVDWYGYATCFRVNEKHQSNKKASTIATFHALARGDLEHTPPSLIRSTNLGHVDFMPIMSGKRNCCRYLAHKLVDNLDNRQKIILNHEDELNDNVMSKVAVCWCDDDNDLDMALACRHAFVPTVSSESMAMAIQNYPHHFTCTFVGTTTITTTSTNTTSTNNKNMAKQLTLGTELTIERTLDYVTQINRDYTT